LIRDDFKHSAAAKLAAVCRMIGFTLLAVTGLADLRELRGGKPPGFSGLRPK